MGRKQYNDAPENQRQWGYIGKDAVKKGRTIRKRQRKEGDYSDIETDERSDDDKYRSNGESTEDEEFDYDEMVEQEGTGVLGKNFGKKGKFRVIRDELPYDFSYVEYKAEVDAAVAKDDKAVAKMDNTGSPSKSAAGSKVSPDKK
jgi:hypothetical protein